MMPTTPTTHHPRQVHAEPGAGRGVGDEVADVDEPADRREDAEEDPEEALHVCASLNASSSSASSGSGCGDVGRSVEVATAHGDAHVGDVVAGVVEHRAELVAQGDRLVVGRLDRRNVPRTPPRVSSCSDTATAL